MKSKQFFLFFRNVIICDTQTFHSVDISSVKKNIPHAVYIHMLYICLCLCTYVSFGHFLHTSNECEERSAVEDSGNQKRL